MTANPQYTTQELSTETWSDFERLFSQGGGWDSCCCMLYQRGRHLSTKTFRTRAEQRVRNRQEKRELVEQGRAHGILVYANKEPVGWCQYGSVDELPLPGPGRQASRVRAHDPTSRWRITCFVTHQHHRGKGVASIALAAVIVAIRRQGGGWVEGCPIALASPFVDRRLRELLRTHGRTPRRSRRTWRAGAGRKSSSVGSARCGQSAGASGALPTRARCPCSNSKASRRYGSSEAPTS